MAWSARTGWSSLSPPLFVERTMCKLSAELGRVVEVTIAQLPSVWLAIAGAAACDGEARQSGGSSAADPSRQVQQVIRTTASPFCPGKTLDSCPSPKAAEWRQDIHEWASSGVPADEIRDRLQERVPGMDLGIRSARWSGVIPVLALLLSTVMMWLVARRMLRRRASSPQRRDSKPRDLLDERLDEELARLGETS
jgi:cytochrome c-type biogenesis protein CcmH/NrfF